MRYTTKKDQHFQSFGCGQTHVVRYMGNCESCHRSVYSHGCEGAKPCGDVVEDSPDPRGVIPAGHCMNLYYASEYGMTGRDVMTCAACAEDADKYRATMNTAVDSGTWKKRYSIGAVEFGLPEGNHIKRVSFIGDERVALLQLVRDGKPLSNGLVLLGYTGANQQRQITTDDVAWETSGIRPTA